MKWIKCMRELPPLYLFVLITYKDRGDLYVTVADLVPKDDGYKWVSPLLGNSIVSNVSAWAHIPDPCNDN